MLTHLSLAIKIKRASGLSPLAFLSAPSAALQKELKQRLNPWRKDDMNLKT